MDEPHSYDFLIYAYLQSGDDAQARSALDRVQATLTTLAAMPGMWSSHRSSMVPELQAKIPAFYALEMRDWKAAAALEPAPGAPLEASFVVYWARALAHGRMRQPEQARADLAHYDAGMAELKAGKRAYLTEGTAPKIERGEMLAWAAFAEGKQEEAVATMRQTADLQDKVGQDEVDIPTREMLADMLLEIGRPKQALTEYEVSLKLSPNRLNGLYNAGRAAEAAGDKAKAKFYYAALLKSTHSGENSTRPEFAHARDFISSAQLAAN
jgi:tetratricopeptide (TPR) repeat protein